MFSLAFDLTPPIISATFEPSPRAPGAVTFTLATGSDPGEVDIDIDALPDWGDATVYEDNGGDAGILEWKVNDGEWATLDATPATGVITVELDPEFWGAEVTIWVRGVSDVPLTGVGAFDTVTVAGEVLEQTFLYDTDGNQVFDSDGNAIVKYDTPPETEPEVIFFEDFTDGLSLVTPSDATGTFYPNWNWMDRTLSWHDFAAKTTMINPNSPGLEHLNPFSVTDGVLTINCFRTPPEDTDAIEATIWQSGTDAKDWLGGMIFTRQTFTEGWFQYRLRCPNPGKGMWPGWWMYGALNGSADYAHSKLEIDLSEIFGWEAGTPFSTHLHYQDDGGVAQRPSIEVGFYDFDTTDFHVWSVDRQATYLRFYYDDILYAEITGADAEWFYGVEMRMIVGNAAGADWFDSIGSDDTDVTTPSPMRLEIDYLRVHVEKPAYTQAPTVAPVITVAGGDGEFVITLLHANFVERATSYLLEVSDDGSTGWTEVVDSLWTRVPTGFRHTDGGYGNGVTKFYRATARNSVGDSDPSSVVSDTTDGGDLVPNDWNTSTSAWHPSAPPTLSANKLVTPDGGFYQYNLILTEALGVATVDIAITCVLGAGFCNITFNGSGNNPVAHDLVDGVNSFQMTTLASGNTWLLVTVQSAGFEMSALSVTPA